FRSGPGAVCPCTPRDVPAARRLHSRPRGAAALPGSRSNRRCDGAGLMVDLGIEIPAGHALVSYAERPDLVQPAGYFNGSAWPEFMHHDEIVHRYWHLLDDAWPEFQLVLLDADGAIAATNNSAPIAWDGTDDGLPDGWDRQLQRRAAQEQTGGAAETLERIHSAI